MEQLEDRRIGVSSCNSGDGADQRVQSLVYDDYCRMEQRDIYLNETN